MKPGRITLTRYIYGIYFLLLTSQASAEDLPELVGALAVSGIPTTSLFYGGVTTDGGVSYTDNVDANALVTIEGLVKVESSHVSKLGNLYVVVQLGESYFFRSENGNFVGWDLDFNTLGAAKSETTLVPSEPLMILNNVPLGSAGLSGRTFYVYLAYDSIGAPGDLFYSGSPIVLSVKPEEVIESDKDIDASAITPNEIPIVKIIDGDRTVEDSDGSEGETTTIYGTASDSDGSILNTVWLVGGSVVATGTSATLPLPDGTTVVTFQVTDNSGNTTEDSITVTVAVPNDPPNANISSGNLNVSDTDGIAGESISLSGTASDSDGSILDTVWLVSGSVVATGTSATLPLPDGSTVVTFQVTDNSGNTTEDSITVTVAAPPASAESMTIYEASISNQIIQARCVNCHGSNASLRLVRSGISGYVNTNYNSMVNYIRGGGSSSILSKPQGIGHGGGVQLSTGSPDLSNLMQFVSAVLSE